MMRVCLFIEKVNLIDENHIEVISCFNNTHSKTIFTGTDIFNVPTPLLPKKDILKCKFNEMFGYAPFEVNKIKKYEGSSIIISYIL